MEEKEIATGCTSYHQIARHLSTGITGRESSEVKMTVAANHDKIRLRFVSRTLWTEILQTTGLRSPNPRHDIAIESRKFYIR